MKNTKTDTQVVEAIGRNLLVNQLLISNIEVAYPIRDRGVDLIVYNEKELSKKSFQAIPLQLKTYTERGFSIDKKYAEIQRLVLVYVWHATNENTALFFALNYTEAVAVADEMGWTKTPSWTKPKGSWSTSKSSMKLTNLLMKYKVSNSNWNLIMRKRF
jgi:hypothetical protein